MQNAALRWSPRAGPDRGRCVGRSRWWRWRSAGGGGGATSRPAWADRRGGANGSTSGPSTRRSRGGGGGGGGGGRRPHARHRLGAQWKRASNRSASGWDCPTAAMTEVVSDNLPEGTEVVVGEQRPEDAAAPARRRQPLRPANSPAAAAVAWRRRWRWRWRTARRRRRRLIVQPQRVTKKPTELVRGSRPATRATRTSE